MKKIFFLQQFFVWEQLGAVGFGSAGLKCQVVAVAHLPILHSLCTIVPSAVRTRGLVSGRLPLAVKGSLLCPVIQVCHAKKKKKVII